MTPPDTLDRISFTPAALSASSSTVSPLDDMDSIVALYQPRLFRFLLISLRDRDAALSLAQDTFLHAWKSRASFRGECGLYTWLMRIAVNLLRDHTRTQRFRFWKQAAIHSIDASSLASHLPHPVSSAESRLIAHQQLSLIWNTVNSLSQRQRSIFLLRFVDGLELHDIATATGLPISTVKSHLYRALASIRARHASSPSSPNPAISPIPVPPAKEQP